MLLAKESSSAELSRGGASVPYSRVRAIAELAMKMEGVYPLYFGESNLPTPDFIKEAVAQALRDNFTYYTSNAGLLSLREAIAAHYQRHHGVKVDAAREVIVTSSGVQALNVAIRCCVDPGDEAILLTPAWPNASAITEMIGAKPIQLAQPLSGNRFTIDFEAIEAALTPRTKLLVVTSPSNPLGWVATVEEQRSLLEFARRHKLWLLADEVYERLSWVNDMAPSFLKLAEPGDALLVVQSFSKSYCMTGWRLGWLAGPASFIEKATQLQEFIVSCPPGFVQKAAETALSDGEPFIADLRRQLLANRDFCIEQLAGIPGLSLPAAEGAFYLFPRLQGVTDTFALAKRILLETKVGVAPGVAFGPGGEGSLRICYAADRSILEPAMARLRPLLALLGDADQ
jgi:hypothetical protein